MGLLTFLCFGLLACAASSTIRGKLVTNEEISTTFLTNTRVLLDGGVYVVSLLVCFRIEAMKAFLREDGSFEFDNIPANAYYLEVRLSFTSIQQEGFIFGI